MSKLQAYKTSTEEYWYMEGNKDGYYQNKKQDAGSYHIEYNQGYTDGEAERDEYLVELSYEDMGFLDGYNNQPDISVSIIDEEMTKAYKRGYREGKAEREAEESEYYPSFVEGYGLIS